MKLSGTHHAAVSPEQLWGAFEDPERLGSIVPGVEQVSKTGDTSCELTVRIPTQVGVTVLRFDLAVTDQSEHEWARIEAHGESGEQRVDATVEVRLNGSDQGTEVDWEADVRFAGALSSLGQQVLGELARRRIQGTVEAAESLVG